MLTTWREVVKHGDADADQSDSGNAKSVSDNSRPYLARLSVASDYVQSVGSAHIPEAVHCPQDAIGVLGFNLWR